MANNTLKSKVYNVSKSFLDRLFPRDIIALVVLTFCFILLYKGVDSFVSAITTLIIGYYFSKRVFEETNKK